MTNFPGGKQPMSRTGTDGTVYTLTYNGELYNTNELRDELTKKGKLVAYHYSYILFI